MACRAAWLAVLALLAVVATRCPALAAQPILALCYHNVEDDDPDQRYVGVTSGKLVDHLAWLRRNGYQAVRIDDLIAARNGIRPLPAKPLLLTFDDGYESFYTRVFPLLKAFDMPAVLAIVGEWMQGAPGDTVPYGDTRAPREFFMTWEQVREVAASGLVEIASHSEALHGGIPANPQGNREPAGLSLRFDGAAGYESEAGFRRRIADDLATSRRLIERETGRRPRVLVWPYGKYGALTVELGAAAGMPITLTLDRGPAAVEQLAAMPRHLVANDPDLATFVSEVQSIAEVQPIRVAHVDLDYVYDADPAQQERNLGALVQRVRDMDINTVYLQAFADPEGTGLVREVYFPNRQLPMRADLFNRVSWQLQTRSKVQVYAWMPVLSFDFPGADLPRVSSWREEGEPAVDAANYQRLSPFDGEARQRILDLYADLARAAPFNGVLFHDDAMLSDFEDASPAALGAYQRAGLPASIATLRRDPALFQRWSRFKTDALIDFTLELTRTLRQYRAPLLTARNMYARPMIEAQAETWYAHNYDRFLASYDTVAVMAMPNMENIPPGKVEGWLRNLVGIAASRSNGLPRTLFELQAVDWRHKTHGSDARSIPSQTLAQQMRLLARLGALNYGYYPDDFVRDHPALAVIRPEFSLQTHPYRLRDGAGR